MQNSKTYRAYTLNNFNEIEQFSAVADADREVVEIIGRVFPFKTNNYVVEELIDWENAPADPLFTLHFPRREMLLPDQYESIKKLIQSDADKSVIDEKVEEVRLSFNPNPSGQVHNVPEIGGMKLDGLQHKYRETVLFFPKQGQTCHAYCTFCFRWPQFSKFINLSDTKFSMTQDYEVYMDYLKSKPDVTDILFTGGDPLTMSTSVLNSYVDRLLEEDMKQIKTIRFGTKSLAHWPYRFTTDKDADDIIKLFERIKDAGKHVAVMAHFNHPKELSTSVVEEAIARILKTGAQIRTQSPVLNHINNDPAAWSQMWRRQVDLGCIPYYMFVARDTGAKHFFELPLAECHRIFQQAYQGVSGICRTVRGPSMSSHPGKIQILGVSDDPGEKVFVLRFIQGRNPNWVARPFFAKFDPDATWIDQLKPAFGKPEFFFESELDDYLNP
ncbi:KamA family radical SAM protein [Methanimicrococcus blatticola]|uniref:L-lysine 2,3-aminomutase n=1 Tax=Methanimicrococcus blatticola TaxID=91560 RepID=A0A484F568_9EURY|nr:lysine 2,3-aminomutase [Methanimicrococcus blatticola]MBZ3936355.1 lysine 2,3-aminomutase [Methanimicrococcus blatticola]MCC2509517.1 lysine 2,3-aminomutase [Methanimicrococcus blatticola]TDQ67570.1 L-lysine 2,3-aminomutase [Methanimicrococcus blatticola]